MYNTSNTVQNTQIKTTGNKYRTVQTNFVASRL